MTGSALRRNIVEHLGSASAADIYERRCQPTEEQVATVRRWLVGCEIAWLTCPSEPAADVWERSLQAEFLPPLNKRKTRDGGRRGVGATH